ncbi:hypothetical protein AWB70_07485 [Caballeronia cordobensis]|uniref:Uncharacterized protein n=1 Tax=Caballeronia cordobensis TaxID=1353886 RepID=A0A158JV30_CABCO|nr:hypothetical protein [Caballeronia cordobensis]SAL72140.1 hypothetical protein AWB70_07485 [Caballeronia cordobensis]
MKRTPFAIVAVLTATLATPVFARDDGPRFAQDRLDTLVAQHKEASRHIAQGHAQAQAQRAQSEAQHGAS